MRVVLFPPDFGEAPHVFSGEKAADMKCTGPKEPTNALFRIPSASRKNED